MVFFAYAYRSLIARRRANLITMLSIALFVAGSLVGVSVYLNLRSRVLDSTSPDTVLVLAKGAANEGSSKLDVETARKVALLDGIKREGDQPLAARELVSSVFVDSDTFERFDGASTIRGIDEQSMKVHRVRMVEGAPPAPGTLQAMVGKRLAKLYPGLRVGSEIPMPGGAAPITGVFEASGAPAESEVWTPRAALELHLKSQGLTSMTVIADSAERVPDLVARIKNSRDLEAEAVSLREHRAADAGLGSILKAVLVLLILLSIVAVAAIATTMNAAVVLRMPELASLVAIGVRRSTLQRMVLVESVLLALLGAALGVIASEVFHRAAGELGFGYGVVELAPMSILPAIGAGLGLLMGVIGGLAPALMVRRLDVIKAMR